MTDSTPYDRAIEALCARVAQQPDSAPAYRALGAALREAGAAHRAIPILRRALELQPDHFDTLLSLGGALLDVGELDEAGATLRQAQSLQPAHPVAHNLLGAALAAQDNLPAAIAQYRQALVAQPAYVEVLSNLADALRQIGALDEALARLQHAITLAPGYPGAHNNLGMVWSDLRRFDKALASFDRAIALAPDNARYHTNRGITLLRCGDFPAGWPEYEWRLKLEAAPPRRWTQPRWQGEPLDGRRIFLHAEQGFGDMIQFLRYVPRVVARGGRVVLESPPELLRLFDGAIPVERLVRLGDDPGDFDCYCPLLSLPGVFQTDLAHIPTPAAYLQPPPLLADTWRRRLAPTENCFRVGLAWRGRPHPRGRSIAPAHLAPLAAGEVTFFKLHTETAPGDADALPARLRLLDGPARADFADLAGLITQMDLVISIDTAAAHLAGAMGKPVWVLLPTPSDWRWLHDRQDSPWYASMRLFRQQRPNDWPPVVERVAAALTEAVRRGRG